PASPAPAGSFLSPTVYPSTSSAVAPGRKSRSVDFASNRDRRIGYCQQSRRELSRLLAAGLSFPFVINGCVCHLLGQPTLGEPRPPQRLGLGENQAAAEGDGAVAQENQSRQQPWEMGLFQGTGPGSSVHDGMS